MDGSHLEACFYRDGDCYFRATYSRNESTFTLRAVDKEGGNYLSINSGPGVVLKKAGGPETNYFGYYHGNVREGNSLSVYHKGNLLKTFSYDDFSNAISTMVGGVGKV